MARSPKHAKEVITEQRKYWDTKATEVAFSTPFHLESFMKFVAPNARVLDYGCGYGRTLEELKLAGYSDLHGLDISEIMVARAKAALPGVDIGLQKGKKLPFEKASFDAVILVDVLCCIIPNAEQLRLIDEIRRILKPNGIVYISDFLINDDDEHSVGKYNEYKEAYHAEEFDYAYGVFEMEDGVLCRHHDLEWIRQLLAEFKREDFQELALEDTRVGTITRSFMMVGSVPPLGGY